MPFTSFGYPADPSFRIRSRGRIPHWELDNGLYFITFHLADGLPREAVQRLNEMRTFFRSLYGETMTDEQATELERAIFRETDRWLDRNLGACYLSDHRAAEIVRETLHFWDGDRYRLLSWTIMPNHVHAVFQLWRGHDLSRVMHSWKSYTGSEINKVVDRHGTLWQREYFDRLIRNPREFENVTRYVLDNPRKAGLREWPWTWCTDKFDF